MAGLATKYNLNDFFLISALSNGFLMRINGPRGARNLTTTPIKACKDLHSWTNEPVILRLSEDFSPFVTAKNIHRYTYLFKNSKFPFIIDGRDGEYFEFFNQDVISSAGTVFNASITGYEHE